MRIGFRRFIAVWLGIVLMAGLFAVPVSAQEEDTSFFDGVSMTPSGKKEEKDLLTAYAQQQLDSLSSRGSAKAARRTSLNGMDERVYNALKSRIVRVAAGEESSTRFEVSWAELGLEQTSWTAAELGVASCQSDEAKAAVFSMISFDLNLVVDALLADCPYELYWYDKTLTTSYDGIRFSRTAETFRLISTGHTFYFPVSSDYAAGEYETDPSYGASITAALNNIRATVQEYAGAPDYDKLLGYRDRICALTDYNHQAAAGYSDYGNPWQLIWVFDNDPSTDVVCEGYSKAFQYLCELTGFRSSLIHAVSVIGTINGASHMWNIVTMETGKNYLVDVTNCDSGYRDSLFLAGCSGSYREGYSAALSRGSFLYVYEDDMFALFSESELTLSSSDYLDDISPDPTPAPSPTPAPKPDAPFSDVADPSAFYYEAVCWAKNSGITTGTSPTTFSPDSTCTRGQFITFLWRAMGEPEPAGSSNPFRDVKESDYCYKAVLWAYHSGITSGTTPVLFEPSQPCRREQGVTFMWRACGSPGTTPGTRFKDVKNGAWYAQAVYWALGSGITYGRSSSSFGTGSACTRGEAAVFLRRFSQVTGRA